MSAEVVICTDLGNGSAPFKIGTKTFFMREVIRPMGVSSVPFGRIYFCIRRILSTNQCLILYTYLGVKSRKKFVYMKGQHNVEFCIHMSSRCNHLYTHLDLNLGH